MTLPAYFVDGSIGLDLFSLGPFFKRRRVRRPTNELFGNGIVEERHAAAEAVIVCGTFFLVCFIMPCLVFLDGEPLGNKGVDHRHHFNTMRTFAAVEFEEGHRGSR